MGGGSNLRKSLQVKAIRDEHPKQIELPSIRASDASLESRNQEEPED